MKYTPYEKYINFLKKHNIYKKEVLMYIREFVIYFDYHNENERSYPTSTLPVIDKQKKVIGVQTILPLISDDITTILNIQEYIKASIYYNQIGTIMKKEPNHQIAMILQILYTKLYISEHQTEELKKLEKSINEDEREECKVALYLSDVLLETYIEGETNLESLIEETEKLINQKRRKRRRKLSNQ